MNVLIVDDSKSIRFFIKEFLISKRYQTFEASCGTEAIEIFSQKSIDLIIMDIEMPGIDGFETTRQIRDIAGDNWLPILFLSGSKDEQHIRLAIEAGGDAYLHKPFKPLELEMQIHAMWRLVEMRNEIQFREEKLQSIFQTAADGIVTVNAENTITSINRAVLNMFHYEESFLIGKPFSYLFFTDNATSDQILDISFLAKEYAALSDTSEGIELIGKRLDYSRFTVQVAVSSVKLKNEIFYTAIVRDISFRKAYESKILYQANYDELTGLANRVMFHDQLRSQLHSAKRNKSKIGVMFIDLDRFKQINDTLGHSAGDKLLIETSARLKECVRDIDIVSRLGGDEFTIILPDLKEEWASWGPEKVASRILSRMNDAFKLSEKNESHVTASIGIALYPDNGEDEEILLRNADTAMYQAKEKGKNTYSFYSSDMTEEARQNSETEHYLRSAISEERFVLLYQPQVCSISGKILSVEALLRWMHPVDGFVTPDRFIHIAEQTHQMDKIGGWVLEEACSQLAEWQNMGLPSIKMSVNVAVEQLSNTNFLKHIQNILQLNSLSPDRLELEITESGVMSNPESSIKLLNEIRDLGVSLAVDDFGTGYSSMSYLKLLPLNKLKIDRAFIKDIESDPNDMAIVRAIIALSKSLKLKVIAEGVETREQQMFLSSENCDEFQGYLFGKPQSANNIAEMLAKNNAE